MHEIFKGLLFLHGYIDTADLAVRRQGAPVVPPANTRARPGNRMASRPSSPASSRGAGPATCGSACA